MGWGVSDYEGYIQSLLTYEVMIRSIGIISQQLSLLYREVPMDGMIAQNGPQYAKQWAEFNGKQMAQWNQLDPKTWNSYGEIKTIERHFTDFDKLVMLARQDVGANCGISDTILFHTLATGFSNNEEDTTLKEAATIKQSANEATVQLAPIIKILVNSCFGYDSPQAKKADGVKISFDSPTVMTNAEKTTSLQAFGGFISQATTAGMQLGYAVEIAKQFIDNLEIPKDMQEYLDTYDDSEHDDFDPGESGQTRTKSDGVEGDAKNNGADTAPKLGMGDSKPKKKGFWAKFWGIGDKDFEENEHPRGNNGEFTSGGGGSGTTEKSESTKIKSPEESKQKSDKVVEKLSEHFKVDEPQRARESKFQRTIEERAGHGSEYFKKDLEVYREEVKQYKNIKKASPKVKEAVKNYTTEDFEKINNYIRTGKDPQGRDEEFKQIREGCEKYIDDNKLIENKTLYRGINLESFAEKNPEQADEMFKIFKEGGEYELSGITSFTSNDTVASSFTASIVGKARYPKIVMECDFPKDSPVAPTDGIGSYGSKEMEYIAKPGQKIRIVSSVEKHGFLSVIAEVF
jgi:hypothetical protein